jgi:hypothetical protein
MSTDHSVTLPIDQALESAAVRAMTYDVPYRKAVCIPFAATSGPTHLDSVKRISFTFFDTPDPPSMHAEANSPVEGSANANSSTAKDWCATSGHAFFIDGSTLPRLLQWQETAPLPIIECDHGAAAHSNMEAPQPCSTISLIPGDPKSPSTFISDSPAPMAPPCSHQHHPQTEHIDMHHHQAIETGLIRPMSCPMDDTLTDTLTKPLPLAKVEHFATLLGLHAK